MKEFNKNNPFKTPKEYFEEFNDKLMNTLSEKHTNIPKNEGFIVPCDYFESLHDKFLDKINTDKTKVVPLYTYKKYYYAIASIAAIILLVFGLNFNTSTSLKFDNLAKADIEAYFEINELSLSTYEIAEMIPIDELEINDIIKNQFNEKNVIDYLNENITDFNELNIEDYE